MLRKETTAPKKKSLSGLRQFHAKLPRPCVHQPPLPHPLFGEQRAGKRASDANPNIKGGQCLLTAGTCGDARPSASRQVRGRPPADRQGRHHAQPAPHKRPCCPLHDRSRLTRRLISLSVYYQSITPTLDPCWSIANGSVLVVGRGEGGGGGGY